ncbi:MAG: hypothetical protein ACOX5R_08345 [bacterium]|jgi:hypothetical protein
MLHPLVLFTYVLFIAFILAGLIPCLRSEKSLFLKCFWTLVITAFPIGGTVLYWLIADDWEELR